MTVIKCGLTGDDHFNVARRSAEAQRILIWMLQDWKLRGVHFIGFAGDFIDGPMTEKERAWMIDYADACAAVAPTLFIMGNHSPELALRCLRGRQTKYPVIVEEGAGVHVVETESGPLAVVGVSYPYKAKLLAATGAKSAEDTNQIAEEALRQVFLGLGIEVRRLNLPTVALIHGAWRGSKIGLDQPDRPLGIEIPIEDMGQLNAGGYCVGHVHLAQATSWADAPIWTPSAPIFTDYGEAGHFKGYIFAEADSEAKKVIFTRIPTPVTPMILLEYKWEDGMFLRATAQRPGDPADPLNGEQLQEAHYDAEGVDFRFRYHYSKEFAAAAKNAADEVKATLIAAGAVNVTPDPKLIPTTRSKIPGLATATKIEDKLQLYWESTGNVPSPPLALQINSCLHELQDELALAGYTITGAGRTAPRLKKVQWQNFFKFPGKHEIDFDRLGELVTVIAPNETGKTILLQIISAGVNYGTTPTRGSLDDLSIAKDSFIEVTQDMNGDEYILTQNCNGMSRSGTVGLIKNGNRNDPVLSRAGRAEYKAWANKNLIPQNLYDSVICQSGTESVIDQKDGPRTELLLRVLGLEILEMLAEGARKRARAVAEELGRIRARIEELGAGQTVAFCEQALAKATDDRRVADEALRLGELTLADLQSKNAAIAKEQIAYAVLIERQKELTAQKERIETKVADLKERIKNNGDILARANAIRAAVKESSEWQDTLIRHQAADAQQRIKEAQLAGEIKEAWQSVKSNSEKEEALQRTIAAADRVLSEKNKVVAAADEAHRLVGEHKAAQMAERDALKAVEELHRAMRLIDSNRIGTLREGLTIIYNGAAEPVGIASATLSKDDDIDREASSNPSRLEQLGQEANAASSAVARLYRELETQRTLANQLSSVQAAEKTKAEAEREWKIAKTLHQELLAAHNAIKDKQETLASEMLQTQSDIKFTESEIEGRRILVSRAAPLAEAETKIAGYNGQLGNIVDAELDPILSILGNLNDKISETPEPSKPIILRAEEKALTDTRAEAICCQSAFAVAEKALADAQARESRRQELTAQVAALENLQAVWTRLGLDLGKDALQKAEICEAGPELTKITNELLTLAGDTRHSVSIETERLHSNKKDTIPCLDIMVFDSVEGISKESRLLSDAGKIIVGWPFSLALIRLGCERAGIKGPTIFIDEATGPCDSENGPRCAQMLRHFAQQLESQVIYVSQQPEIQALADSRIFIGDQGAIAIN